MNRPTIIIDAGHGMGNRQRGSYDPGARSQTGLAEAELTFQYARKLNRVMTIEGWAVTLTRPKLLTEISLKSRNKMSIREKPTCLVSLHCNADIDIGDSARDDKTKGTEIWYRTEGSRELATSIEHAMVDLPRRTPDTKQSNTLIMLNYTPSVIIEIGFIDDPEDVSNMLSKDWSDKFIEACAIGINKWREHAQCTEMISTTNTTESKDQD